MLRRAEHNCHLCKKEWLGRCFGTEHYGEDVSLEGDREENRKTRKYLINAGGDLPICSEYEYGGSPEHLKDIEEAEKLGVRYLEMEGK